MRRALLAALAALALSLGGVPARADGEQHTGAISVQAVSQGPEVAPGAILVKFRKGVGLERRQGVLAAAGASLARELPQIGVARLGVPEGDEEKAAERLRAAPEVEYAEPDYLQRLLAAPNDPLYSFRQWHLARINAPAAWETTTGSPDVVLAVLDTGVDSGHPDLVGRLVPGTSFVEGVASTEDDSGHGTAVAGVAAAATNNGEGTAGVAWDIAVMPVKTLDAWGTGTSSGVAQGILWAVDHGAKVVNISSGSPSYSQTLQDAVDYAWEHGVLVVAAVGNAGGFPNPNPTLYPAANEHVLGVGATDGNDRRADFSERGSFVDLGAPGINLLAPVLRGRGAPYFGSNYDYFCGTSLASPIAAAVAALVLSASPSLAPAQAEWLLETTARDVPPAGRDDHTGYGRVDAGAAVGLAAEALRQAQGGYTLDGWGGVHPFGSAAPLEVSAYWPGWDIARDFALLRGGEGGYVLDGWGGVHPFGSAPYLEISAYWPGWDIARSIALLRGGGGGYVLDAWGGVHPFGSAPYLEISAYWPGWDIARSIALLPSGGGGYVLDAWGGVHPFGSAPNLEISAYWPGRDMARDLALLPDGAGGYVLDREGGLYPFGAAARLPTTATWPGQNMARGLALLASGKGGYVLDAYGALHPSGAAPARAASGYWPGQDIARAVALP